MQPHWCLSSFSWHFCKLCVKQCCTSVLCVQHFLVSERREKEEQFQSGSCRISCNLFSVYYSQWLAVLCVLIAVCWVWEASQKETKTFRVKTRGTPKQLGLKAVCPLTGTSTARPDFLQTVVRNKTEFQAYFQSVRASVTPTVWAC